MVDRFDTFFHLQYTLIVEQASNADIAIVTVDTRYTPSQANRIRSQFLKATSEAHTDLLRP